MRLCRLPGLQSGVYERGALRTYQPVAEFSKTAGQQPNLVGYYSGWGEPFENFVRRDS